MKKSLSQILFAVVVLFPGIALCQSNMLVAVEESSAQVAFYDLAKRTKIAEVNVGFKPHEVAIDKVNKRCFVTNFGLEDYFTRDGVPGSTISVIDLKTFKEITRITTSTDSVHCKAPHGIKIRPGKGEIFTNTEGEDTMLVYDLNTYKLKRKFRVPAGTHNFRFTVSGDSLWLMSGKDGIYHVNPENGQIRKHIELPSTIRGLVINQHKIIASLINEINIIDPYAVDKKISIKDLGVKQIIYSGITNDGKYIFAPYPNDSVVVAIDVEKRAVVKRFITGHSPTNVITYKGLAYVSNTEDDHISIIDIAAMKIVGTMPSHGANGIEILE